MTLRPGCPIRRSTDQRLLAPPRGLSQRATSFIASQCQGIHQMPLTRLIPSPSISQAETKGLGTLSSSVGNLYDHRLKGCPLPMSGFATRQQHRSTHMRLYGKTARGRLHQIYNDKQLSDVLSNIQTCSRHRGNQSAPRAKWWAREDLNFRPHAYQARALTN